MKVIIDSKIYNKLSESDAFTYLGDTDSEDNHKPVGANDISGIGKVNDKYGEKSPTTDTIANMLTPQSYLRTSRTLSNPRIPRYNVQESLENIDDSSFKEKLNHVIDLITNRYRDGKTKAEIINYILLKMDLSNVSGDDKNNIRNNLMK